MNARLQEALRISRMIRAFEVAIQDEREPIARKIRRWQRLRTPSLPDWAQELRPHDLAWDERFALEASRIRAALGPGSVHDTQHIGSSAIPHLCSKPVLDMVVVAPRDLPIVEAFAGLGYEPYGNSPCDLEADWFWNMRGEDCLLVVHLCDPGNPWPQTAVNFRDYLRAHPGECEAYDRRKRELSAGEAGSLLEYSLGKLALFYDISGRADAWRSAAAGQEPWRRSPATTPGNSRT